MLQEVLEHIHNYFIKSASRGTFSVAGGVISPAMELLEGQRFLIMDSVLDDGVYTYHASGIMNADDNGVAGLQDETFAGTICALAVPPAVIALSAEISQWVEKYGGAVNSPFQSENVIGVYSYTKATAGSTRTGAGDTLGWEETFRSQLNRWRKVAFL